MRSTAPFFNVFSHHFAVMAPGKCPRTLPTTEHGKAQGTGVRRNGKACDEIGRYQNIVNLQQEKAQFWGGLSVKALP